MDAEDGAAYLTWLETEQFPKLERRERVQYWLIELAWGAGSIIVLFAGWGGLALLLNSAMQ